MPTFIDSLLLEVGLDSSAFRKGAKETQDAMKETKDKLVAHGKAIEESSKKTSESIEDLAKKVLSLYAVLIGAESIGSFIDRVTKLDTSTLRLGQSIQTSVTTISELDMMAERFGGSGAAMNGILRKLNDNWYDLSINGKALPIALSQIMSFSGKNIDFASGPVKQMMDLSTAIQRIAKTKGTGVASYLARQYGLDDATISMMIENGPKLKAALKGLEPLALTPEHAERAERFEKAWAATQQTATNFAHTLWTTVSPALVKVFDKTNAWLNNLDNQKWFNDKMEAFSDWLDKELPKYYNELKGKAKEWLDAHGGVEGVLKSIKGTASDIKQIIDAIVFGLNKANELVNTLQSAPAFVQQKNKELNPFYASPDTLQKYNEKYGRQAPEEEKTWETNKRDIKGWFGFGKTPAAPTEKKESWGDWLSKKFIGAFDMRAHAEGNVLGQNHANTFGQLNPDAFGTVKLEGREVNRGNPLPVWLINAKTEDDKDALAAFQRNNGGGGSPGGGGGGGSPGGGGGGSSGGPGRYTMAQLVQMAKNAGFQGEDAAHIAAIAMAESKGNPNAIGGAGEVGLTQINPHAWPKALVDQARTGPGAFAAAMEVYKKQGWGAWSTDPSSRNFTPGNSMKKYMDGPDGARGHLGDSNVDLALASGTSGAGVNMHGVNNELAARWDAMKAAMPEAVKKVTRITSAFRDYAEQARLYWRFLHGGPLAAPPGRSQHNRGEAMDVHDPTGWVHAHAHEFGLQFALGHKDWPHMSMNPRFNRSFFQRPHVVPNSAGTPTSHTETNTHIASIVVHTRAKDAHGIAANIKDAMRRELHTRSQEGGLA